MSEGTEKELAMVSISLIKAGLGETAELCNRAYNEMGDQRRKIAELEAERDTWKAAAEEREQLVKNLHNRLSKVLNEQALDF